MLVVAFYTGNDPLESYKIAYNYDTWKMLIPDPSLDPSDMPDVTFPPPPEDIWPVEFSDGIKTEFSPKLRLSSNMDHPAVKAGYAIMISVAKRIVTLAKGNNMDVVFTVIPTKELVYAEKIKNEKIPAIDDYLELVSAESRNIEYFVNKLNQIPESRYIDVIEALTEAALGPNKIYPPNVNGHPIPEGYKVIGETIARTLKSELRDMTDGLVAVRDKEGKTYPALIRDGKYWLFSDPSIAMQNGWKNLSDLPLLQPREVIKYPIGGIVTDIDPQKYGPM